MPIWKFAPTSRNVAADTPDLARDFVFELGDGPFPQLPLIANSSTSVSYEGTRNVVSPSAVFNVTFTGQNLSVEGGLISGGTINTITMTIAGATHVRVTGLSLSGEDFGNLLIENTNDNAIFLERFLLQGNDKITGTGLGDVINGIAGKDQIVGNGGDDDLDGGVGNDRLFGGAGSDDLFGGSGNDVLYAAQGTDGLSGGAGADRFVFNTNATSAGTDSISDFSRVDTLVLDSDAFRGIGGAGKLDASRFKNTNDFLSNLDPSDRIFYIRSSGSLWYDADGSGFNKSPVLIAFIDNNARITVADFQIIN